MAANLPDFERWTHQTIVPNIQTQPSSLKNYPPPGWGGFVHAGVEQTHGMRYFVILYRYIDINKLTSLLPRVVQNTSQTSKQYFPDLPNNTSQHIWFVINVSESQNGVKSQNYSCRLTKNEDTPCENDIRYVYCVIQFVLCTKIIDFGIIENKNPEHLLRTEGSLSP